MRRLRTLQCCLGALATTPCRAPQGCFDMTQARAARHLGFSSPTTLKKAMGRLGIKQWPNRKRSTVRNLIAGLEVRAPAAPAGAPRRMLRVRRALQGRWWAGCPTSRRRWLVDRLQPCVPQEYLPQYGDPAVVDAVLEGVRCDLAPFLQTHSGTCLAAAGRSVRLLC